MTLNAQTSAMAAGLAAAMEPGHLRHRPNRRRKAELLSRQIHYLAREVDQLRETIRFYELNLFGDPERNDSDPENREAADLQPAGESL